jgi:hypothetical protein
VNRREALRNLAGGAVGAAASTSWVESLTALAQAHAPSTNAPAAIQSWAPTVLTPRQNEAVVALTELIIPQTDTPGAKAALVNRFIDRVLSEASAAERESFLRGLAWMDDRSRVRFGKELAAASAAEQTALLTSVSDESKHAADDRVGAEFFQAIKSMTISGYYGTEIGLRQELGDDGQMYLAAFAGCDHPEHQG